MLYSCGITRGIITRLLTEHNSDTYSFDWPIVAHLWLVVFTHVLLALE